MLRLFVIAAALVSWVSVGNMSELHVLAAPVANTTAAYSSVKSTANHKAAAATRTAAPPSQGQQHGKPAGVAATYRSVSRRQRGRRRRGT